jgi:hypothetical protein
VGKSDHAKDGELWREERPSFGRHVADSQTTVRLWQMDQSIAETRRRPSVRGGEQMRPRLNYVPEVLRAQAILRVSAAVGGAGAGAGAMGLLSGRQSALDIGAVDIGSSLARAVRLPVLYKMAV